MLYWEFFFKKEGSRNNDEIFGDLTEYLRLLTCVSELLVQAMKGLQAGWRFGDTALCCFCFFVIFLVWKTKSQIAN